MAKFERNYQNQLQFNLAVPIKETQLTIRAKQPDAIVVERLDKTPPRRPPILTTNPSPNQALKFSVISEDKLSLAVRLAKRDLHKKKMEERLQNSVEMRGDNEQCAKLQTQIVRGREYKENRKRRKESNTKSERTLRERVQAGVRKEVAVQVSQKRTERKLDQLYLPSNVLPVSHSSSPVRDDGPRAISPNAKQSSEIARLRDELKKYMRQIRRIEDQPAEQHDDRDDPRREARHTERAARSARMLYVLQQQVRSIREDTLNLGPGKVKHTKKSVTVRRLAAAHRGAVRALHSFSTHLSDRNSSKSIPSMYKELALLVRQLSMCCAELEVGGETGVPDSVINVLPEAWPEEEFTCPTPSPIKTERVDDKWDSAAYKRGMNVHDYHVAHTVDRLSRQRNRVMGIGASPDREHVLRAALETLRKNDGDLHASAPIELNSRTGGGPLRGFRVFEHRNAAHGTKGPSHASRKGLLLPQKLKSQREKIQKPTIHPALKGASRFSEGTHASHAKICDAPHKYIPPAIRKARSNIRRDNRTVGVRYLDGHSGSTNPGDSTVPSDFTERPRETAPTGEFLKPELERQAWLDGEGTAQARHIDMLKRDCEQSFDGVQMAQHNTGEIVRKAEEEIRERLEPLLREAKEIANRQISTKKIPLQSLRHKLSDIATDEVGANAAVLSDMILNDLLLDTVQELERLDTESECEQKPVAMQQARTLESVLQHIQRMEMEQEEIRMRWSSISYSDERETAQRMQSKSEVPHSEIRSTDVDTAQPLVFTKRATLPSFAQKSRPTQLPSNEPSIALSELVEPRPGVSISIPSATLKSIGEYNETFVRHLRKISHQVEGTFDPVGLSEDLAADLLDLCIEDIAEELQSASDDIVQHVYSSEFVSPSRENST